MTGCAIIVIDACMIKTGHGKSGKADCIDMTHRTILTCAVMVRRLAGGDGAVMAQCAIVDDAGMAPVSGYPVGWY